MKSECDLKAKRRHCQERWQRIAARGSRRAVGFSKDKSRPTPHPDTHTLFFFFCKPKMGGKVDEKYTVKSKI